MDNDIQALRSMIAEAKRIAFLGGAGLSTASGIPDFRSEDGIYRAIREFGHPPETLLSHSFFLKHTAAFYRYYRKYLLYPNALPNRAHTALAKLEWGDAYDAHMAALAAEARAARDGAAVPPAAQPARAEAGAAGAAGRGAAARGPEPQGKLTAIVTQNIDDLHQRAGSRNVLELHGSVYRNRCLHCGAFYSLDALLKKLDASPDGVPRCGCGGVIKPDVVLYGEGLDQTVLSAAIAHISRADLLIIGGTSLMVYPAAALIDDFRGRHVVVINLSDTGRETGADLTIRRSIDEVLSEAVD